MHTARGLTTKGQEVHVEIGWVVPKIERELPPILGEVTVQIDLADIHQEVLVGGRQVEIGLQVVHVVTTRVGEFYTHRNPMIDVLGVGVDDVRAELKVPLPPMTKLVFDERVGHATDDEG